jgi:hypothetical protein
VFEFTFEGVNCNSLDCNPFRFELFLQRTWLMTSVVAVAVAVEFALFDDVAVMVHEPAVAGAVYTPQLLIDPYEADQFTAVSVEKVWVFRACRLTFAGIMVNGATTVTVAIALFPPAVGVAVTALEPGDEGAV